MTGYVPRGRPPEIPEEGDPLFVRAVGRAAAVLSAFHQAEHPLSLTEIARAADLDRSTAQRLVHTLRKLGYITRDRHDRGFVPGRRIYDHIFDAMRLDSLIQRAVPYLLELRSTVNERVDMSLLDDTRLIYVSRLQPKRKVLHDLMVGLSVPVCSTSGGWALLARLPEEEAREILARSEPQSHTPRTLTDPAAVMEQVDIARERGYAIAMEQLLTGEIGIAAAVTDASGRPVGGVTITALLSDWTPEEFERAMAPALMQTVRALSRF
ncbi:IclR family transcriptional regulator [Mangrovicoccus algicola]|uniref:IclR family transcriptional regulator n=1 Tax=Mangrovicoccus algicola TaxID=2771008 RepID=A0A8J7CUU3_9RHOB|nr:IclR family transcriptional regulator [Mangrovicoccus algicola]MBE3637949.1 IclR family transcriptional regulator [Mangrovicoccus algicola]